MFALREKSVDLFEGDGSYGWLDASPAGVRLEVTATDAGMTSRFATPAASMVVVSRLPDDSFVGTITYKNGKISAVTLSRSGGEDVAAATPAAAQSAGLPSPSSAGVAADRIRFVHMGGNDCPPCVAWRSLEYPKLENSPAFEAVGYSYVVKAISSHVPAELFLPSEVKPLKSKLDYASAGKARSPHQIIIVDGEVYHYWIGAIDARDIDAKIAAITSGTRYPGTRCKRLGRDLNVKACDEPY